jgi:hypothetical protein
MPATTFDGALNASKLQDAVSNPLTCRRYADFETVGTLVPYGQHLRSEGSAATALSGNLRGKRCTIDHLLSSCRACWLRPFREKMKDDRSRRVAQSFRDMLHTAWPGLAL